MGGAASSRASYPELIRRSDHEAWFELPLHVPEERLLPLSAQLQGYDCLAQNLFRMGLSPAQHLSLRPASSAEGVRQARELTGER
ncbi:hypothetical protein CEXT_310881 [Caerostris extrusa]|uniref:Uncharacterized protein n=1 Tax=Caerostris extrusa TaxID=172846 RepID=A0AAV4S3D8_CAEEX|nr:hypothetical protein CEXT_310881 [Caerostris extrusa]